MTSAPAPLPDLRPWQWSNAVAIPTPLAPREALEHLADAWPNALVTRPAPHSVNADAAFSGQYVTWQRAAVRITLHGTITCPADGQTVVRLALVAEPYPLALLVFGGAALLLPMMALLVDALAPAEALAWWLVGVGLFATAQWFVAGVTLRHMTRKLTTSLAPPR